VGQVTDRPEAKARSGLPTIPSPLDPEASSAESGDSEIELVSEDPMASEDALPSSYVTFGHVAGPPPSPASPSIQYSILREEREAELDSELIIESCDASSASEESPKREQDSPPIKPCVLDAIREESARAEERTPGPRGPGEPVPCPPCPSAVPQTRPEPPRGDGASAPQEPTSQRKPAETASSKQSPAATEVPGPREPGIAPSLLFLNKQKGKVIAFSGGRKQACPLLFLPGCPEVSAGGCLAQPWSCHHAGHTIDRTIPWGVGGVGGEGRIQTGSGDRQPCQNHVLPQWRWADGTRAPLIMSRFVYTPRTGE
jgi:hypothetical protein